MFFSPVTNTAVLVQSWTTATVTGTVLAVVTAALMSLGLECLKCYIITTAMISGFHKRRSGRLIILKRLTWGLRYMMDVLVGYLLMLMVMTFNTYIFIAVIIGAGMGYFFCRPVFLHRLNKRLHCRKVSNELNFSMEDVCHDCTRSSDVHDSVQKIESSGSIVKIKEEEMAPTSPSSDLEEHIIIKATQSQV